MIQVSFFLRFIWSYDSSYAENPGNILYVTGLSLTVTEEDLEEHFANRGKVITIVIIIYLHPYLVRFVFLCADWYAAALKFYVRSSR